MRNSSLEIEKHFVEWDDYLKNIFVDVQEIARDVNKGTPTYDNVINSQHNTIDEMRQNFCKNTIEECNDYIKKNKEDSRKIYCKLCDIYKKTYEQIYNYINELEYMLKNSNKTDKNNKLIFKKILDIQESCKYGQKFSNEISKLNNIISEPRFNISI